MKKSILYVAGALLIFSIMPKHSTARMRPSSLQQQPQEKSKIFSGTIIKNGDKFLLSDAANKLSFVLDDSEKASQFEGKRVKVTGTVDTASNIIHVETIQEIA
jgi:uncharacterized protein YdeI (BOF family)